MHGGQLLAGIIGQNLDFQIREGGTETSSGAEFVSIVQWKKCRQRAANCKGCILMGFLQLVLPKRIVSTAESPVSLQYTSPVLVNVGGVLSGLK